MPPSPKVIALRASFPAPENPKSSPLPGLLMLSAVIIGIVGMIFQSRIKTLFTHTPSSNHLATAPALSSASFLSPSEPVAKKTLPPVPAHLFHITSISLLGTARIAVIDGQQVVEGHAVSVPGQPGWKVAEIHDGVVVLDYFGNRIPCPIEIPATKPLHDQLHPLN